MVVIGALFLQTSILEPRPFGFALNVMSIIQGIVLYISIKS